MSRYKWKYKGNKLLCWIFGHIPYTWLTDAYIGTGNYCIRCGKWMW